MVILCKFGYLDAFDIKFSKFVKCIWNCAVLLLCNVHRSYSEKPPNQHRWLLIVFRMQHILGFEWTSTGDLVLSIEYNKNLRYVHLLAFIKFESIYLYCWIWLRMIGWIGIFRLTYYLIWMNSLDSSLTNDIKRNSKYVCSTINSDSNQWKNISEVKRMLGFKWSTDGICRRWDILLTFINFNRFVTWAIEYNWKQLNWIYVRKITEANKRANSAGKKYHLQHLFTNLWSIVCTICSCFFNFFKKWNVNERMKIRTIKWFQDENVYPTKIY